MSRSVSPRTGSYARVVDAMSVRKDKANDNKPSKAPKSPDSSRPTFGGNVSRAQLQKAQRALSHLAPYPQPTLQPRGMGEKGVNWHIHTMKMRMMRDKTKGGFSRASGSKIAKEQQAQAKAAKWREQNLQMRNLRKKVKAGFGHANGSKAQRMAKAKKAMHYTQRVKVDFPKDKGPER